MFGNHGPAHDFLEGEEAEELGFVGELGVAGVGFYAVEEVMLFVVVGGEDYVPGDALEGLFSWVSQKGRVVRQRRQANLRL